jgi:hypothetical protein
MVKVTADVDLKGFNRALEEYQQAVGKSWPEVLRQQGRLLAVNLATETQPWGDSSDGFEVGKKAVMRDVGRVFASGSVIYDQLMMKSRAQASAYWMLMNRGQVNDAERILVANGIDVKHIKRPDHAMHKARIDRRGHVYQGKRFRPSAIVFDEKSIESYGRKISKNVGTGKAGWAQCAEELGGARGIPQWAKRNRSPGVGGVIDNSSSFNNPSVTLENRVSYIGTICKQSAISKALSIQKEKMIAHIKRVLEHHAKTHFHQ